MKAIITRYKGATNTRGSRVIATDGDRNRVSIPYPHDLNQDDAHRVAAVRLCEKMGWPTKLLQAGTPREEIFIFTPASFLELLAAVEAILPDVKYYAKHAARPGNEAEQSRIASLEAAYLAAKEAK